ncbi:MAG: hypothetical protein ACRDSR_11020 [Pseudonocardiaceae bacterium]
MSNRGPIITLLAVAALAAVLVGLNVTATGTTVIQEPTSVPSPTVVQQASYAGRTSGNEATIAIAVRDGQAAAYVCDGRRVEAWLQGTLEGGRLAVQNPRKASATGTVEGDAIFGTVSVNGNQWPYSAQLASPPAGLYQGSATVAGVPNRIGWIVLPDGSQTGIRKSRDGLVGPAPPLDPRTLRGVIVDGVQIDPQRVEGDTRVVRPPS